MSFLESIFNFISSIIGAVLGSFKPVLDVLKGVILKIKTITDQIKNLLNMAPSGPFILIIGPIQIIAYLAWGASTIILYAIDTLIGAVEFFLTNSDFATYAITTVVLNVISFVPSVQGVIAVLPEWIKLPVAFISILPLMIWMWNYLLLGQNVSDSITNTKQILLNPTFSLITDNFDLILYFAFAASSIFIFLNDVVYEALKEILPQFIFFTLLLAIIAMILYPIIVLSYLISQGFTSATRLINETRARSVTIFTSNIDIVVYLICSSLFTLSLTDEAFQSLISELLPRYVKVNLYILVGFILFIPFALVMYYWLAQQSISLTDLLIAQVYGTTPDQKAGSVSLSDAILVFRKDISNVTGNIQNVQNSLLKVTTAARPIEDPNSELTDTERMFFAQLFSDNPSNYPSKIYYPGSISGYSGTYKQTLPKAGLVYKSTPGIYDKLRYEDLNLEFYNNANYKQSVYSQFFGKTMTRADYISLPFQTLSSSTAVQSNGMTISTTIINRLTGLVFDCLNVDQNVYKTLSAIPDSVLASFASGKYAPGGTTIEANYICYAAVVKKFADSGSPLQYLSNNQLVNAPTNSAWPTVAAQRVLWPSISQIHQYDRNSYGPTTGSEADAAQAKYVADCNQAFIYYSFTELMNNLGNIGSGFNESLDRWSRYLKIWGADDLTNPAFVKSSSDLMSYIYTFADCSKNIVMFNDFLSYALLPTTSQSALASQSLNIDNAYTSQVFEMIKTSTDPNSSANLFKVADYMLELIAAGISLTKILGLYTNVRQTNANFLFNRAINPNNPLSVVTNGLLASIPTPPGTGSTYSASTLTAVDEVNAAKSNGTLVGSNVVQSSAQIQSVLKSFAQNVSKTNIVQALEDAPGQNGYTIVDGLSVPNMYGSPYIRRLFYDASGILSTIYTDLFSILRSNVFISGSKYVPTANDPLDMMWFRYTVQNWNNPFDGTKYGNGQYVPNTDKLDGANSYICGGYNDRDLHINAIFGVLGDLSRRLFTSASGATVGIYDRINSLLDCVVAYNNIIDQAFTLGILGSSGTYMINSLISNLSNRYLRLDQNDRYMDLTSLLPQGVYQHFHINVDLSVPRYSLSQTAIPTSLSNIADLRGWISQYIQQDAKYLAFKNEIATAFIFKLMWDMIWWPQFCVEYYYTNGTSDISTNKSKIHRWNYLNGVVGPNWNYAQAIGNGKLTTVMDLLYSESGQSRMNSIFFSSTNRTKYSTLYDMINGVMPSGYTLGLNTSSLPANNQFMWKSFCYAYRHDLLIPYALYTAPVMAQPNQQPLNYSQINYNSGNYAAVGSDMYNKGYSDINGMNSTSFGLAHHYKYDAFMGNQYIANINSQTDIDQTILSPYRWLSNYTSVGSQSGGTKFPSQMIMDKTINNYSYVSADYQLVYTKTLGQIRGTPDVPVPPSPQLYTKFAPFAADRKIMRTQFFADPFSWFDINKSYQLYPLQYGNTTSNNNQYVTDSSNNTISTTWLRQDYAPMFTKWGSDFGRNDFYYDPTMNYSALDYTTAYAPLIDTSMVDS